MEKICKIFIDNQSFEFEVEGDFFWGKSVLLYPQKDNVLSKVSWENEGFNTVKAFENQDFLKLQESVKNIIIDALKTNNVTVDDKTFDLKDYHKLVTTDALHNQVISITRNLETSDFDFDIDLLTKRFGDILGYKLTSYVEELKKSHIQIRISRPKSLDINPPHRDGYLSYWENIINVWLPIAGCNEKSSLPVVAKSHLIPENEVLRTESKGAKINGNIYYVPCILETKSGTIKMTRPNPKEGEALLFSPFLIHGAAVNENEDITRVSLELRFPKQKN
ncbi:phytanoyl-CoA dioxygenase family protein [Winogradskyella sediminis]|uniref:Phytanoyl-CoA dioxygenase (PhyH) n=1 Tax=Winogradskyella sediminis TaxID=1382466 RepID=A0A1H1P2X1_9FLAO|nr:phytanoyl-CoA dioxygenase family protein [Winogradskyella sediminis]REG90187.1 phytanoyl-CoA dioxygenase PhyH [Winogradskyella sediminis]SDS04939.1 Phytanoyl-CoA dioxygenase (PhyH) [Winogradskyella sediminis]